MANFADIVVKDSNGTDVTYVAQVRAGGEGSKAVWVDTRNPIAILRPSFSVSTKENGTGTARRVTWEHRVPVVTAMPDNTFVVRDTVVASGTTLLPSRVTEEALEDSVVLQTALLNSSLIKEILGSGYNAV